MNSLNILKNYCFNYIQNVIDCYNIRQGMEIQEVGEGIPVQPIFEENVLKYHRRGS
jgi:hypothetical protein